MSEWTQVMEAQMRRLWNQGATGTQISEKLGVSRCAVLGKARRMKLDARNTSPLPADVRIVHRRERQRANVSIRWATDPAFRERKREQNREAYNRRAKAGITKLFDEFGAPVYFRRHDAVLPPDASKADLRNFLAQAVRNTAALQPIQEAAE